MVEVYQEYRPAPVVAPFVECGWVRSSSAEAPVRVIPDGCVDVFVTAAGAVMISGPATTFYDQRANTGGLLTGLRLWPGAAAAVLGHPVSELRDDRVPVDSVFGVSAAEVSDKVLAANTSQQRVATLETMLARHFATAEPVIDRGVAHSIEMLRDRPELPVSEVASTVGLSQRQLRRRFDAAVGLGPKRLGRIFRFQRLLNVIHAGADDVGWSELAVAAGYADQSHMINECLALAGAPPTGLPGAVAPPRRETSVSSNTGDTERS